MRRVILYGKPGCGLCDEARDDLDLLAGEFGFDLQEIDITGDAALFERFRYVIPVVDVEDGELLFAPLTRARLREALVVEVSRHG